MPKAVNRTHRTASLHRASHSTASQPPTNPTHTHDTTTRSLLFAQEYRSRWWWVPLPRSRLLPTSQHDPSILLIVVSCLVPAIHCHMHHGEAKQHRLLQLLDLLTLGLWSKLGKLVHYGVDAILSTCLPPAPPPPQARQLFVDELEANPQPPPPVSTILAGMRRSTGLT